jgi:hypothetical protein
MIIKHSQGRIDSIYTNEKWKKIDEEEEKVEAKEEKVEAKEEKEPKKPCKKKVEHEEMPQV